ncbi:MAG TPA: hypothetical protein VER96_37030 [Polyangiaceae bacterium]|nr:hypothetical protein [Polyangiaceae bacterium]
MAILRNVDSLGCVLALGTALLAGACGGSNSATSNGSAGASNAGSNSDGGGSRNTSDTSSTSNDGGSKSSAVSAGGASGDALTECPKSALTILFSPMYSAYDGVHTFQVPAVVNGLDASQIAITWSASDPSMVKLETDPTTGGVMITTRKAGTVSIIASAGNLCGSSLLTITSATSTDWEDGSMRYNDGVVINRLPRTTPPRMGGAGGAGGAAATGSGGSGGATAAQAACTNCHGDTASGPYKTVQHTPEQTGGFSDADLIGIFQNGTVPKGGYFDDTIVSYAMWQSFHKWDVGDTPQNMVIYLRSLTPAAQTGSANFGGLFGNGGAGGRFGGFGGRPGGTGGRPGMMNQGGTGGSIEVSGAGGSDTSSGGTSSGGTSGASTSSGGA